MGTERETAFCSPLSVMREHSGLGFSLLGTGLDNGLGLDCVFFSFYKCPSA